MARLRLCAGLSVDETADALSVSRATAFRDWAYARAWPTATLTGESARQPLRRSPRTSVSIGPAGTISNPPPGLCHQESRVIERARNPAVRSIRPGRRPASSPEASL
jgi:hypothetical protein